MAKKTATVRITGFSFGRVLNERIGKIADDVAKGLAEECAEHARENFKYAIYAGPQSDVDDIVVEAMQTKKGNWSVTAKGKAVQYIEFGTGIAGEESGYEGNYPPSYHPVEEHDSLFPSEGPNPQHFWVFRSEEEPQSETEPFYRWRRVREEIYDEKGNPTGKFDFSEDSRGNRMSEKVEVEGLYKTRGNPANSCLYDALVSTAESAAEIAREARKK